MRIETNNYRAISVPRPSPDQILAQITETSPASSLLISQEMELTAIIFVAMCVVTPTISAPILPSNSSSSRAFVSDAEILISLLIVPRVKNATEQMKLLYPFITTTNYFQEPPITLGLDLNKDCINKQTRDKLGITYSQMAVFMNPLYFAFAYEDAQSGPLHSSLASVLDMTSYFVNDTVAYIKRQMKVKGFLVPGYPMISEARLDERTLLYLDILVQNNIVTLTITDDMVKTYRNYVIVYMLRDIISEIGPCL